MTMKCDSKRIAEIEALIKSSDTDRLRLEDGDEIKLFDGPNLVAKSDDLGGFLSCANEYCDCYEIVNERRALFQMFSECCIVIPDLVADHKALSARVAELERQIKSKGPRP